VETSSAYCIFYPTVKLPTSSHAWASLIPPKAYKQRRGTYFYYNRAAIGLACAQATAMRIDIAPHKRPRKKQTHHVPNPHYLHIPPHAHLRY
jgi:hypothetical protein